MKPFPIEHSPIVYRLDLVFYAAAPWLLGGWMWACAPRNSALLMLSWAVLGVMAWSLIEYLLHRFVLHGLAPFSHWHEQHHQRPRALICLPTACSASLLLALILGPSVQWLSLASALALTWGVLVGYAAYTWVHHATHHAHLQSPWFRRLKIHHALHHALYQKWGRAGGYFGVTSSLWDRIFRTLVR